MDVTRENFGAVLDGLLRRIETCDFFALDLEMTGINNPSRPENGSMDLQQLYEAKRHAAERYSIIQVGVALFEKRTAKAKAADTTRVAAGSCPELQAPDAPAGGAVPDGAAEYDVRSYNIFVFPTSDELMTAVADGGRDRSEGSGGDVVLSPSAIEFLKQHGLDFQRWMYRGVPYVDNARAQQIISEVHAQAASKAAADAEAAIELKALLNEQERQWLTEAEKKLRELAAVNLDAAPPTPVGAELALPPIRSANACAALSAVASSDARLAGLEVVTRGRFESKDAFVRRRSLLDARWNARRALTDKLGFWTVFDSLARSGKPCVTHNGFADWCFLHDAFIGPLPGHVNEFCASVKSAVRGPLFDTKYMATYLPTNVVPHGRFRSTGLGNLFSAYGPSTPYVHLRYPEGFQGYHPESMRVRRGGSAAHEAGYDAMMTGAVFANLSRELPVAREMAADRLAVFGSLNALDVSRGAKARVRTAGSTAAAVAVNRGEVVVLGHPERAGVGSVLQALPVQHQFAFPTSSGEMLLALEPEPAKTFEHPDPIAAATLASSASKKAKAFGTAQLLKDKVDAARAAGDAGLLAKLTVEPFDGKPRGAPLAGTSTAPKSDVGRAAMSETASNNAAETAVHAPWVPAALRSSIGKALCSAARRLKF